MVYIRGAYIRRDICVSKYGAYIGEVIFVRGLIFEGGIYSGFYCNSKQFSRDPLANKEMLKEYASKIPALPLSTRFIVLSQPLTVPLVFQIKDEDKR